MMRPFNPPAVSLAKIAESCNAESSIGKGDLAEIIISGVTHTDSDVVPGDLFVAIPGAKHHGAEFSEGARKRGAVAVLTDQSGAKLVKNLPVLVVNSPRIVAGRVGRSPYRDP